MNWEKYNGTLKVGDIVEMSSKVPSSNKFFPNMVVVFVKHYGVVVMQNDVLMMAHNPFGGRPEIVSFETIFTNRDPERVLRTNKTNEEILSKFNSCVLDENMNCKNESYKFFHFNCEDFVSYVCDCNIGRDQRVYYFGTFFVIITLAIVSIITHILTKK